VRYFESNAESVTCAILLDTTGSMQNALPRLKNSVLRLIDELGPDDSIVIYSFAAGVVQQQEFTKDKAAAKRAVLRLLAAPKRATFRNRQWLRPAFLRAVERVHPKSIGSVA
jgi:hypothetical protein